MIAFDVLGTPAPQGSKRAFVGKSKDGDKPKVRLVEAAGAPLNDWRAAVATFANGDLAFTRGPLDGPLAVTLEFRLQRPRSIPKRRLWPHVRPDLDKLVRATLDGLTGVAIADDSCVVLLAASKRYALDQPTGCHITIAPADTLDVSVAIIDALRTGAA